MAKKKKVLGALGPQPHWLRLSLSQREKTKQYIKEGLQGWVRDDGVSIPGARRVYVGLSSRDGYDLRHIERWTAAKLARARERIQSINTLTSRPFTVLIPRSKKQRVAAQKFTGQNLSYQKEMIAQVQDPKIDRVKFKDNKVITEREFKSGSKAVQQRYLFSDYTTDEPNTFLKMRAVTKKMLPDMPQKYFGRDVYYTIITTQYGPIGESVLHEDLLNHLVDYHNRYDPSRQHQHFAEQVIGFQMVGTYVSAAAYQRARDENKAKRKQMKKLRFAKLARCNFTLNGKRCIKEYGHTGKHRVRS